MVKKILKGIVVSHKMDKTIVVKVDRKVRHPRYEKLTTKSKKFYVHDENNTKSLKKLIFRQINKSFNCVDCGACVGSCPQGAILVNPHFHIDENKFGRFNITNEVDSQKTSLSIIIIRPNLKINIIIKRWKGGDTYE